LQKRMQQPLAHIKKKKKGESIFQQQQQPSPLDKSYKNTSYRPPNYINSSLKSLQLQ